MSDSGQNRHLVAAFVSGAAIIPATVVLAWAWLVLSDPEPCGPYALCFRGLGPALVSAIASALVAGIVAQHHAKDTTGWVAMLGGIGAAAVGLASSAGSAAGFAVVVVLLGVPATVGYGAGRLFELVRGPSGQDTDVRAVESRTAMRDIGDGGLRCESCGGPLTPHARSCPTCLSAVLR